MKSKDQQLLEEAYQTVLKKHLYQLVSEKHLDDLTNADPWILPRLLMKDGKPKGDGTENNPYSPSRNTVMKMDDSGEKKLDINGYPYYLKQLFDKLVQVAFQEHRTIYFVWENLKFVVDPENRSGKKKSLDQQMKEMKALEPTVPATPEKTSKEVDPYANPAYYQTPWWRRL